MSVSRRRLTILLFLPLLSGLTTAARAHNAQRFDLQIITADQSKSTSLIVDALRGRFPTATFASQASRRRPAGKQPIYLAVGPEALRHLVASATSGPIISTFTSFKVFHSIVDRYPARAGLITAIYADPAPAQQAQLINLIYGKPIKIGVILSADNPHIEDVLRRSLSPRLVDVVFDTLAPGEDISRVLTRLADVQAILATPDSAVYNAETIRTILVSTYRRNQAVIGFSAAIVKAGALASTFSDIEDTVAQVDDIVTDFEANARLPEPQFPRFYDALVNEDVARSLNIVISDPVRKFSRKPGRK